VTAKLTLQDIADLRTYERQREEFRDRIIALKKLRRVEVGPVVTIVFENRETVRFQVQEMARAERMGTDAQIQAELDAYNPLIPGPGELTATLFLELTSPDELREWLPRLVGIQEAVRLVVGNDVIPASTDPDHAARLTRDEVTASVHYIRFVLTPEQIDAVARGPVDLAVEHPAYRHAARLSPRTVTSLLGELRGLSG
jgi:hypothetical protein